MATRLFAGVDLSQTGLALVTATPEAAAKLDWSAIDHVTVGESLPSDATPLQKALRIARLRHAAILWLRKRAPTDVVFEAYPVSMQGEGGGGGGLRSVAMVIEMGGALRASIAENFGIGPIDVQAGTARKILFGGSMSHARLAIPLRGSGKRPNEKGAVKLAVRRELESLGASFNTADECDAFVALNGGLAALGLEHWGAVS